jgi:nicotinate-nucleotide pyrophosphorylase (carboxylating)
MANTGYVTTPRTPPDLKEVVARALGEDVGAGDLTASLIPAEQQATAVVVSREAAVLCGIPWFEEVYAQLDPAVRLSWALDEGARLGAGTQVCHLAGPARSILTGERTALNFLQTLSATATCARECVDLVKGSGAEILDTRKTLPGLRSAQKYAVACGGARNHRMGLYDAVLIKENHIAAAGGVAAAVERARRNFPNVPVEIEVESLLQLEEALVAQPDIIMLDNFDLTRLRQAVRLTAGRVRLEASGNVTPSTLRDIAATGVDCISVGGLTKNVKAVDFSMRFSATTPPA